MQFISKSCLILVSLIFSSCSAIQPLHPKPALLLQPTADSRKILEHAVGGLFKSQPIKLADNVFTQKSTVIIEPRQPKDGRGNVLDGREIRQAHTVTLLIENGKCYVKHDQTGLIERVENISCHPSEHN